MLCMKQIISYQIPVSEGHNIAEPTNEYQLSILDQVIMEETKKPVDRFAMNLCGCLEDECTCIFLDEVKRLKENGKWWG